MELVKEIIERKKQGQDCTEQESAEIKMWIKETIIQVGTGQVQMVEDIQTHFPIEYGEALDEMDKKTFIFESEKVCPKCESTDVKERSGYQVCFNCGNHF